MKKRPSINVPRGTFKTKKVNHLLLITNLNKQYTLVICLN